jgi:hypothetical protein
MLTSCLSDEHLEIVNDLLPKVSAMGAYYMGIITSLLALSPEDTVPTRELFERAARCSSPSEAVKCFEEWEREVSRK